MYLAFYGAVHPACFAASGQNNAETKQQAANHRIWASPHDFWLYAKLDIAEDANGAHRHPGNNRFRHHGTSGDPHIAKRGGEADLCTFNQQAKAYAEQHCQTQFRLV